jgi:hypothetical protein
MNPKSGYRFPACAKPMARFVVWIEASAGEARSEKIMLQQELKRDDDSKKSHRALALVGWDGRFTNGTQAVQRHAV